MTSTDRLLFVIATVVCLLVAPLLALAVGAAGLTALVVLGWR